RMLHTLLGEDDFQKGMKLYIARHDGTAATCEDFVLAMEEASGIDLQQFRLWYSQSGTPLLKISSSYQASSSTYTLTIEQTTEPTADQPYKQPLHIPLDIELYQQDGTVIPLQCNGEAIHHVLNVTKSKQTFVFDQVPEKPILSLLREFSAPVKLEYDYTDQELSFLMVHATNDFARWDAGQMLLAKYIRTHIESIQQGKMVELPDSVIDAFRGILLNDTLEPAFIAEVLTLPNHNEVSGWYKQVDVDAIAQVLHQFKVILATELADELSAIYHLLKQEEYSIAHAAIGRRALRNTCLGYLAYTEQGERLVNHQYQQANNMTDTMAAMNAANSAQLPCREALMNDFSAKWQHDGLVMDKWFTLQGTNPAKDALLVIKNTMQHPAFSMKNPNRIRSLIGSFLAMNPVRFHAKTGEGYQFAGEILRELNTSNPQVASRLIDPLLKFRLYDQHRQTLMKKELEALKNLDNLANDLFEKVTKALD
ncbi:DUF3458 domain-containing protein, partial [Vibrio sp. V29_P1S30P107]|uniref:DUF3458 domain-containing protein n=2 Tax=Vibrio TaxID=662 RepID=UPI001372CA99